jgi:hypothetical protein
MPQFSCILGYPAVDIDEIDSCPGFIDWVNVRNGVIVAGYENRSDWGGGSNGQYSEP